MCFHSKQTKDVTKVQNRFKAKIEKPELFETGIYNGFSYPKTPVITNLEPDKIQFYNWGLIASWAKDQNIREYTLNARTETITTTASFKDITHNRCLILADGFFEWMWLDSKGRKKQKYELALPDNEAFAFAGLWSKWLDNVTGEPRHTYTIMTTEANELMAKIHNSKKRMPMILSPDNEKEWLQGNEVQLDNDRLLAFKQSELNEQIELF